MASTELRTAAQQALDFIRWSQFVPCRSEPFPEPPSTAPQVEAALKAALVEPVQEPVAWMVYTLDGKSVCVTDNPADFIEWRSLPLYTTPPQRKPLTEEEIGIICASLGFAQISPVEVARAIERAHGIGGQP